MQRVAKIKKREDPEENVDSDGLFAGDIIAQQATYGTLWKVNVIIAKESEITPKRSINMG